jgi:hypothetical protein
MRVDLGTKLLLAIIAVFLGILALRPVPVRAQTEEPEYYIEPGHTLLRKPDGTRQVLGKVIMNLRTGEVWGFPTGDEAPYPIDTTRDTPPTSRPIYLGRFDLTAMQSGAGRGGF